MYPNKFQKWSDQRAGIIRNNLGLSWAKLKLKVIVDVGVEVQVKVGAEV